MEECLNPIHISHTNPYEQYFIGEKDEESRRNGSGRNHWTGAESLENYEGQFLHDSMHGLGEYRWRHHGPEDVFATYEGHFYNNTMHGYGDMSYQDGNIFTGLFYRNIRWGPGIQTQARLREDVGLWRGTQLIRLTWTPPTPNIALNLNFEINGKACVQSHRIMLTTKREIIGEVNSAIELMKQTGTAPMVANEVWNKLYSVHSNDISSQLCDKQAFEKNYYGHDTVYLEETDVMPERVLDQVSEPKSDESLWFNETYYAWNNNQTMIHMMKHCFMHDSQRMTTNIDLEKILVGPRNTFKPPGKHELDCRTLLMTSYLGYIKNVAQLVNELNVNANVSDIQGNNAIMYAACGDQPEIIHFLHEAGGDIDGYNDNCCTPLGVTLMRFACVRKDIFTKDMVQAWIGLPTPTPLPPETVHLPLEWNITREFPDQVLNVIISNKPSPLKPLPPSKKTKSTDDFARKRSSIIARTTSTIEDDSHEAITEENRLYYNTLAGYTYRVNDLFSLPIGVPQLPVPYLLDVDNMVKVVLAAEDEQRKQPDKGSKSLKSTSKLLKNTVKPSKDALWKSSQNDSLTSVDKAKLMKMSQIISTIVQLLRDGANPRLVRCPQPAVLLAVISGSPEVVQILANYGADLNEVYPTTLGYTALDIALSKPLTNENLEMIQILLESGARTDHLLIYEDPANPQSFLPGPTLLHAVLAKPIETGNEEEIQKQILELLLQYGCNPTITFNDRSAIDVAMDKSMNIFDIFIKCPRTNLNTIINTSDQTILVKMFTTQFLTSVPTTELLQTITNLLLFGADPFLECKNGMDEYKNVFVYAKNNLSVIDAAAAAKQVTTPKSDKDKKQAEKPKVPVSTKSAIDNTGDYKQGFDLLVECSRTLIVRWLQGKLFRELLEVVIKYKHRRWNMIIPEHKSKKACSLWLSSSRCIEIWNIYKSNNRKQTLDHRPLKYLLCIMELYNRRANGYGKLKDRVTTEERNQIEIDVNQILKEYKCTKTNLVDEIKWGRPYVMPELSRKSKEDKYDICFECLLPQDEEREEKIICLSCKLVWFCSMECMKENTERTASHPCHEYLKNKYFPTPSDTLSIMTNPMSV